MVIKASNMSTAMSDFANWVKEKAYEKYPYDKWREFCQKFKGKEVSLSVDGNKLYVTSEDDDNMIMNTEDQSFGSFLYERFYVDRTDFGEDIFRMKAAIASGEINKNMSKITPDAIGFRIQNYDGTWIDVNPEDVKVQCTSSQYYPKKNFKLDLNKFYDEEKKDMKGFNFDFGPVNGNAVRMSMYGMAVKNKVGTFVSYDVKSGEIMDVDVFNFDGANFLYKMPVAMKDIAIGDVVIHHGAPMFVVGKSTDNKGLVVIDVIAGERKEIMLAKSPFGFNFATKVVNFLGDAFNGNSGANADNPFGNVWMLMAMSGDNKDMSDMLPFMMMANGGKVDSNMMMFMAMSGKGGNDMLPMLMMMNAMNAPAAAPAHECHCGGNCGEHHQ